VNVDQTMSRETDTAASDDDPAAEPESSAGWSGFDWQLLSDLSVNVVPIVIILALVLLFNVLSPTNGDGEPLVLFHTALIGGVVLVSIVAGWIISGEDSALEGSAASGHDDGPDRD
jgi:hypothetical protein